MTPNPTVEELLDNDKLVNGDMGAAWNEIVSRLSVLLPALITADNAARGWVGGEAMAQITRVTFAPTDITAKHKNIALVQMREATESEGIGGAFMNVWICTVHLVGDLSLVGQQLITATRRRELVKTALFPFLSGVVNKNDRLCWRSCIATEGDIEHDEGDDFSRAYQVFLIKQPPSYQG